MSLINFLNPKLQPSVFCDTVCTEGFSAQNLIADDPEELGFVGFTVTKPPTEIIFDFPNKIDIRVIKLWNSFRNFRSTAFEIYSKYEGTWQRVGYVQNLDKIDSVSFCYQHEFNSQSKENLWQHSEKTFFFKTAGIFLSNISTIKIIIRATIKCPPILKKVQIWGLPSRLVERTERELITSLWNEIQNPNSENLRVLQDNEAHYVPDINEHCNLKIPEEFLDSITWELMIFPMVLPCGKVVDQSTIDKHACLESKWGRMPSDPFTNLEFNSQRKAILNLALKARIEQFLMTNSEHFKTSPRSLGSLCFRRGKHVSKQNQHHASISAGTYSSLLLEARRNSTTSMLDINGVVHAQPFAMTDSIQISKRAKHNDKSSISKEMPVTSSSDFLIFRRNNDFSRKKIDLALKSALQNITRYTCPLPDKILNCCISCKCTDYEYEIKTCRHLACRECIIYLTGNKLCKCGLNFSTSDVGRYHKI